MGRGRFLIHLFSDLSVLSETANLVRADLEEVKGEVLVIVALQEEKKRNNNNNNLHRIPLQ